MERTAEISQCERHRYLLGRVWEPAKPVDVWIMLNPSTADAMKDDPTIRRVVDFSRGWGSGGVQVVNLFSVRATDPYNVLKAEEPNGPIADDAIRNAIVCNTVSRIVCAWGTTGMSLPKFSERADSVYRLVLGLTLMRGPLGRPAIVCLGRTANGNPRHPLYLPKAATPIPYERECDE